MPAERPSWPPRPGCSSTLWTTVPTGMFASGRQLPVVISALGAGHDHGADLESRRGQDVGLLAVHVVEQRDVGGPVGVVLDRGDLRRDAVLAALEVDAAVEALGAAAAMARGLAAVGVAAAGLLQTLDERALGLGLRDLREVGVRREATTGAGGLGLANGHALPLQPLQALEDRDRVAGAHLDDGLLPLPRAAGRVAAALGLGADRDRADVEDLDARRAPPRPGGSASCARPDGRGRCTCRWRRARSSSR